MGNTYNIIFQTASDLVNLLDINWTINTGTVKHVTRPLKVKNRKHLNFREITCVFDLKVAGKTVTKFVDFFAVSSPFISVQCFYDQIQERKVLHRSSLQILLLKCTKLINLTLKCTKFSFLDGARVWHFGCLRHVFGDTHALKHTWFHCLFSSKGDRYFLNEHLAVLKET